MSVCLSACLCLNAIHTVCCRSSELLDMTCRLGNVLREHGIQRGDRVAIYMPVFPLAVAAMLACARIGAVHRWSLLLERGIFVFCHADPLLPFHDVPLSVVCVLHALSFWLDSFVALLVVLWQQVLDLLVMFTGEWLGCAGVFHCFCIDSVVFAGFGAESLKTRILDGMFRAMLSCKGMGIWFLLSWDFSSKVWQ